MCDSHTDRQTYIIPTSEEQQQVELNDEIILGRRVFWLYSAANASLQMTHDLCNMWPTEPVTRKSQ